MIPLVAGYVAVLVALIVLVIDITAVQLARAKLYDVADALALDAADEISQGSLYRTGMGRAVPLTDQTVRTAAQRLLDAQPRPSNVSDWRLDGGTGAEPGSPADPDDPGRAGAVVVLTGRVEIPMGAGLLGSVGGGGITVTVRSRAEAEVARPAAVAPRSSGSSP